MDPKAIDQKIIDLFDEYTHTDMSRRDFLDRLTAVAGSTMAALAILPALENNYALAQTIPESDPRLVTERVEYKAGDAKVSGYLARPKDPQKRPAVVVIHENRGLNPHIQDVARRVAVEGFLTLAPDLLSPLGGTPSDADAASKMISTLKPAETLTLAAAAVPFVEKHAQSLGRAGVIGFCWGGGLVNQLAAAGAGVDAAVAYYGMQLPASEVPKISSPLLLHYAGLDERINKGMADYEAALKANNKPYELYLYEGANHAFNNDTNAARYNKEAATLAWTRTIAFLKKNLGSRS